MSLSSADANVGAPIASHRVGRPRRGTESTRIQAVIAGATRVFLREGYGFASIDRIAIEAGVSTRTIYARFKNKAELLGAVVTTLIEHDTTLVLASAELNQMPTRQALTIIGHTIAGGVRDPAAAALFRLVATEAHRFPELAEKMRSHSKARIGIWVANYLCEQTCRGNLILREPDWAAVLFVQMICAELHEYLLFGPLDGMSKLDVDWHVSQVSDIFLIGAAPRE